MDKGRTPDGAGVAFGGMEKLNKWGLFLKIILFYTYV